MNVFFDDFVSIFFSSGFIGNVVISFICVDLNGVGCSLLIFIGGFVSEVYRIVL